MSRMTLLKRIVRSNSSLSRIAAAPHAGFTLLEITLVMALMGLITALALPRALPEGNSTALRIKAFEVAALLRSDRNAALRTGRIVATVVDLTARRVRSGASDAAVVLPDHYALRLVAALSNGIQFFPDGRFSGGELIGAPEWRPPPIHNSLPLDGLLPKRVGYISRGFVGSGELWEGDPPDRRASNSAAVSPTKGTSADGASCGA